MKSSGLKQNIMKMKRDGFELSVSYVALKREDSRENILCSFNIIFHVF